MPLAGPIKLVKSSGWTAVGVDFLPITLSGDPVDLTDPEGPTGGYSARAVQIGATGGNLVCMTLASGGSFTSRTVPVAANTTVQLGVCYIFGSGGGTTATPVGVLL